MNDLVSTLQKFGQLGDRDLRRELEARASQQWPTIVIEGKSYLNFCSNDYLGMSNNPRVLRRIKAELNTFGFGAGGAALLTGRSTLHSELETNLSEFTGFESALLYSSGYLANLGAIGALVGRKDLVFHDRFNHASLIDAVLATRCKHKRYPHLSVPTLKSGMKVNSNLFVITESVFSMDGDTISTKALSDFCADQKATLYIDDAHGFGVTGKGRGIAAELLKLVQPSSNLLVMVTLGKALGASGGVVLGSKQIIEYLTQFSRPFIYDTAPPPVVAAAALEALSILREDSKLLEVLEDNVRFFRNLAKESRIPVTTSDTPIQPIKVGDSSKALNIVKKLKAAGIYVRAIRPPTVPMGTARLRVTISSQHTKSQIRQLVDNLSREISLHDET